VKEIFERKFVHRVKEMCDKELFSLKNVILMSDER